MKKQIDQIKCASELRVRKQNKLQRQDLMHRNNIVEMNTKMDSERSEYFDRVSKLETLIQEDIDAKEAAIKAFSKERPPTDKLDEASELLGFLKDKWVSLVQSKKQEVDSYVSHCKLLFSCVQKIREKTNVTSLDEMVTSFQTSFEENLKLKDYAERLSCEIDELTIQLANTRKLIEANTAHSEKTELEIEEIVTGTRSKIEGINSSSEEMRKQREEINAEIENLSDLINSMKTKFEELGLRINIGQNVRYGEDINFNVANARDYLFEIDQYISKLLIYRSTLQPGSNPEIASLDLESIIPKTQVPDDISISEFLERDVILNNDEQSFPMTTRDFQEKINGLIPTTLTPREAIS